VAEQEAAPVWAPLADLWSWTRFSMARATAADGAPIGALAWITLPLFGWMAWRLYRGRRVMREHLISTTETQPRWPGHDSEFYLIEKRLNELGWRRNRGETPFEWLARLSGALPRDLNSGALTPIARLHYRYRFDPDGLTPAERRQLKVLALEWLQQRSVNA
jgi:hypothetical protein